MVVFRERMHTQAAFYVEGGYRTVSVSLSSKASHSHNVSPILTKFLLHVHITEKFYNFKILRFHKKVEKYVAVATVFHFKL